MEWWKKKQSWGTWLKKNFFRFKQFRETAAKGKITSDFIVLSIYKISINFNVFVIALTQHPTPLLRAPWVSPIPNGWKQTIPEADNQWVAASAFKWSSKWKPELDTYKIKSLVLHPPSPPLVQTQVPKVDRNFAQRLFMWMPKKLWQVKLHCWHEECEKNELTGARIHPRLTQVLDLHGYYAMAAEYLSAQGAS